MVEDPIEVIRPVRPRTVHPARNRLAPFDGIEEGDLERQGSKGEEEKESCKVFTKKWWIKVSKMRSLWAVGLGLLSMSIVCAIVLPIVLLSRKARHAL